MEVKYPALLRLSTTVARKHLSEIVVKVQDPRSHCILTRHNKPVAAIVSMTELHRIWRQQDMDDLIDKGRTPAHLRMGGTDFPGETKQEVAEQVQQVQLDRRRERQLLIEAGLRPIPGGELEIEEVNAPAPKPEGKRAWWRRVFGR
ncbi:MAG: type II toxin-antitoxin system Phd/YefM family antitoxin [Dinoroseobacter sp.]|nr:type II toxin-antitoxin system Phd/YefM family antitoxin [Dinoroseobacter sp.]